MMISGMRIFGKMNNAKKGRAGAAEAAPVLSLVGAVAKLSRFGKNRANSWEFFPTLSRDGKGELAWSLCYNTLERSGAYVILRMVFTE